jgi:hypothetical protein
MGPVSFTGITYVNAEFFWQDVQLARSPDPAWGAR